jgi:hypothetical protein
MGRSINGMANGWKAACNSRRSFSLDDQDRLDLALFVSTQALFDCARRDGRAVLDFQSLNIHSVGCRGAAIEIAEMAVHATQRLIAGRKRIDNAGLPTSCARAGEKENLTLSGFEEFFQALDHLAQKDGKLRSAMVDQRLGHRPNNALRHDARTRDLKKRPTRHKLRER